MGWVGLGGSSPSLPFFRYSASQAGISVYLFPVFLPSAGTVEVVLQGQRLDGQTVVGLVHEQADLPVYVPWPQVLRGGAEQDYLVVTPLQVIPQPPGPLVVVSEGVGFIHQNGTVVGEHVGQDDAVLSTF